jgi:hypothetical protein
MPTNIDETGSATPSAATPLLQNSLPRRYSSQDFQANNQGRLGTIEVGSPRKKEFNEWRDALGAALGGAGGSPYWTDADSDLVKGRKQIGLGAQVAATTIATSRLLTGRVSSAVSEIAKKGLAPVSAAGKTNMATAAVPFGVLHGVYNGAMAVKGAYDITHEICADISQHKKRQQFQRLLEDYNPITGEFKSATGGYRQNELAEQALHRLATHKHTWNNTEGGNLTRSVSQRALDVGSKIRDWTGSAALPIGSLMSTHASFAASVSSNFLTAATGLGGAAHGFFAAVNFARAGVQTVAIANIEAARRDALSKVELYSHSPNTVKLVPTNQMMNSVANRMIQERVYLGRMHFWNGMAYALSSASAGMSLAGGGVGYLVTSLLSALALTATAGVGTGFTLWHNRKLAERRAYNVELYNDQKAYMDQMNPLEKQRYFQAMDSQKYIGVLERHLLNTLRSGSSQEYKEVANFLYACGISKNTIKSLVVLDEARALASLQTQLYSARPRVYPKNFKYIPHAAGYLSGVTYLKRYIEQKRFNQGKTLLDLLSNTPTAANVRYDLRPESTKFKYPTINAPAETITGKRVKEEDQVFFTLDVREEDPNATD